MPNNHKVENIQNDISQNKDKQIHISNIEKYRKVQEVAGSLVWFYFVQEELDKDSHEQAGGLLPLLH